MPTQLVESGGDDSEAGPVRPCKGLEWVVIPAAPARAPDTTHSGPMVLRGPLRCIWTSPRLLANRGEITPHFS